MKHLLTLAVLCLAFGCAQPPANPAFETNVEHAKTWFEKFSAECLLTGRVKSKRIIPEHLIR